MVQIHSPRPISLKPVTCNTRKNEDILVVSKAVRLSCVKTSSTNENAVATLTWNPERELSSGSVPDEFRHLSCYRWQKHCRGLYPYTKRRLQRDLVIRHRQSSGSGFDQVWSLPRVPRGFTSQGHASRDGATDLGQEDCHHCFDCVEEYADSPIMPTLTR